MKHFIKQALIIYERSPYRNVLLNHITNFTIGYVLYEKLLHVPVYIVKMFIDTFTKTVYTVEYLLTKQIVCYEWSQTRWHIVSGSI